MSNRVILLHGLGRTRRSMAKMARALDAIGFRTLNLEQTIRFLETGQFSS